MLGKLLKFELKHSARYVMTIYGCAAVLALFMLFGLLTKITFISVVGSIILYFIGIVAVVMTIVAIIKNFYDTLYGKQGYLTFTLPAKSSSILLSKVLISFFWIIMSMLLMVGIFALIFLNAKKQADGTLDGISIVIESSGILDMLPSIGMFIKFAVYVVILLLMNILVFVGFVFFSVTLANTRALQKHPKAFGFLIFFASYLVSNSIGTKLTYSFPLALNISSERVFIAFSSMSGTNDAVASFGIGGTIFMSAVAVALLFATGWIMEHKVNIK